MISDVRRDQLYVSNATKGCSSRFPKVEMLINLETWVIFSRCGIYKKKTLTKCVL